MLSLRPYLPADAQKIMQWYSDEYSFRQWCGDCYETFPIKPKNMNDLYDYLQKICPYYILTACDENEVIGHLTMRFTDSTKTVLRFGFVIIDPQKRGQGIGKEMMQLALGYAFSALKAKRVTLAVFKNNAPALRCYRSAGLRVAPGKGEIVEIMGDWWASVEMECRRLPGKR